MREENPARGVKKEKKKKKKLFSPRERQLSGHTTSMKRKGKWYSGTGKRKQPDTPEQVAAKCAVGAVGNDACERVRRAKIKILVEKFEKRVAGTKRSGRDGLVRYLSQHEAIGKEIIETLGEVGVIPPNANILDFLEANDTLSGDKGPRILEIAGESERRWDTTFNQASHLKEKTTLVYVVKKGKGDVEYSVWGRKMSEQKIEEEGEKPHLFSLKSEGSWLTFPSSYVHKGDGPARMVIALVYYTENTKAANEKAKNAEGKPSKRRGRPPKVSKEA